MEKEGEKRGILINVLAVLVVLGIGFFSQSSDLTNKMGNWQPQSQVEFNVPAQAGEWVTQQKDVAARSVWEKIKNYFAEMFSKYSGTKVE